MIAICKHNAAIVRIILIPILLHLFSAPMFGMGNDTLPVIVSNVDWRVEGEFIVITYDLAADAGKDCEVKMVLLNEKNEAFSLVPRSVSGDIGKGKFSAGSKEIRWEYRRDFPDGLPGDGYFFEIRANYAGGFPWLTVGLSAAAIGGGLIAIFGSKKGSTPSSTTGELPTPPGRP